MDQECRIGLCTCIYFRASFAFFGEMDIMSGVNAAEREIGMASSILCSLSGNGSELLWPAVFKRLETVVPTADSSTPGFCKTNRSMIFLELGVKREFYLEWAVVNYFWASRNST